MAELKNITPMAITKPIMQLCKSPCPNVKPVWVEIKTEHDAIIEECFPNVERKILKDGGSIQYGWNLRELTSVLVEGEFHAVWVSQDGKFIDITPPNTNDHQILFLPDKNRIYEGVQVNNQRLPLNRDRLVRDFISLLDEFFKIQNKGERKYHQNINISPDEINPIIELRNKIGLALESGLTENDLCFCGSDRKYKNCCTEKVHELIRRDTF